MKRDALEQLAATLGGLSILGCLPGSPSAEAGLRYGDVLLEVNGQPTPDLPSYLRAIRDRGTEMQLRVFRDGAELWLTLPLPERPPAVGAFQLLQAVVKSGVLPAGATPQMNDDEETVPKAQA